MNDANPALLPSGLLDLLPPDAEAEARCIAIFMQVFASFGYSRVKPPLVEFEDTLLGPGPGQALARNTFRLMDPVSQRMMAVRADTTAQIARLAATRMSADPRPLRLSYAADVLRVNGSQLRPERQFCQVGCELIGPDDPADDAEICLIALKALNAAGIGNLTLDLTVPTLAGHLFNSSDITDEDRADLLPLIHKRDADGIRAKGGKACEALLKLLDVSGPADEALAALAELKLPAAAKQDVQSLQRTLASLREGLKAFGLEAVQITIDPLETRGFEYQTGVSFTLFAKGVRGELGRGGRYNIVFAGKGHTETATGFTLYMDSVRRALPPAAAENRVNVPAKASWSEIRTQQESGNIVVRGGKN